MKKHVTKALGVILSAAMIFGSIPAGASPTFAEEVPAETAATSEVSVIDIGNEEKESDESSLESETEMGSDDTAERTSGEAAGEAYDGELDADFASGDNVYPARMQGSYNIKAVYSGGSYSGQYDNYKIAISNVDKDVNINTLRNVQATATYSGNAAGRLITGMSHTATTAHAALYQNAGSTNYNYLYATFQLNIPTGYRIAGVSYSGQGTRGTLHHLYLNNGNLQFNTTNKTWNSGTANLLTTAYAQDGTAQAIAIRSMVDIFYNAGVGTTSTNYKNAHGNVTQTVTVSPITYTLSYNANGGTGAPAAQTMTYDTAGALSAVTPTATGHTFAGWSIGGVTYNAGQTLTAAQVSSFASSQNANVVATAQWTPITYTVAYDLAGGSGAASNQSVTYGTTFQLPAAPAKTGYSFAGWQIGGNTYSAGQTLQTAAFSSTQGATVTFKALWSAHNYKVKFVNEGQEVGTQDFVYGTAAALKTLGELGVSKPGYSFKGWNGAYTDGQTVKDLTAENGGAVTMTAQWEANTDTPYTVYRYVQIAPGDTNPDNYVLYQSQGEDDPILGSEVKTATTDTSITETPVEIPGYITPAAIGPQTIAGDGSTTFVFYYNLPELINTIADYKVEHYIQKTPDGEYEKFSETSNWVEKGTVVTPELDQKAVDAVNAIDGCKCEKPQQITQSINEKGTVIKYYYKCVKKGIISSDPDDQGMSDEVLNEIAKKLAAGLSFSMEIEGVDYEIVQNPDGTLAIKFATTTSTKVVIPDVIKIGDKVYRITEVYEKAFKDNTTLKEVVISQNVSKIGNSAFEGCKNLEKVTLKEGLVTIGDKAFKGCSSLTSISMPATLQTIGNNAFENCTKLKTVTLNEGLLKIGSKAFYNCKALTKIKIPKTVLKIGSYAFGKCIKLKTVTFATDSQLLTLGTGVFSECKVLAKIKLPDKLTNVPGKAFYNCKKLASATIGKSVTKISTAAFRNCSSLKKITIPEKVQTIGKEAFYNCKNMKDVKIKSKALTSVGSKAFKKCKKGLKIVVPGSKTAAYKKLLNGKY